MKFDLNADDLQTFERARDALLDRVADGTQKLTGSVPIVRAHMETFLDWNFEHRAASVQTITTRDMDDYLLGWLPRNYLGGPAEAPEICASISHLIEYLVTAEEVDAGFGWAAALISHISTIAPEVEEELGSDENFGLGKSLLTAPLSDSAGRQLPDLAELMQSGDVSMEELQELLDERTAAFNELPFEVRKQITDQPARGVPLPFAFVPPSPAAVERAAESCEVVRMVDAFLRYADQHRGIALTSTGNIKLADARALVAEMETGDLDGDAEKRIGTSLDLRWLTLVDDLTEVIGATCRLKTKINPEPGWFDLSVTEKAVMLCDSVLDEGFLAMDAACTESSVGFRFLIDDGVPHWLSPCLIEGESVAVQYILETGQEAVSFFASQSELSETVLGSMMPGLLSELFVGLERFGLLVWEHRPDQSVGGTRTQQLGGEISLTELGRFVLPKYVEDAGYSFETIGSVEEASAEQLIDMVCSGMGVPAAISQWRVDQPVAARAQAIVDAAMARMGAAAENSAAARLVAFDLLGSLGDPAAIEHCVRQLLDTQAAAYVAGFLLEHGLATLDEVGAFIDLTPLVDTLSTAAEEPELFDGLFQGAVREVHGDLIEELWHHNQPETLVVLEAAGEHVSDKALAKSARKAVFKHRSWLANQNR